MEKLKWTAPTEKEIESAILYYLNYQVGCFAFKVNTMGVFDQKGGFYRQTSKFVMPGTPDIITCIKIGEVGVFVGFEVKSEKGRQSIDQKLFQKRLNEKTNGYYFIVRSIKDVEIAIDNIKKEVTKRMLDFQALVSRNVL